MKSLTKSLRHPLPFRSLKQAVAQRESLLPLQRTFDDDADDATGFRTGWQPARRWARLPRRPSTPPGC